MRELAVFYCPKCGHYAYYQTSRHPLCPKCSGNVSMRMLRMYYTEFMKMTCEERDNYLADEMLKQNPSILQRISASHKRFNSRETIAQLCNVIMSLDAENKMLSEANKLFASLNMNVNPGTIMRTMSVSQRQMVEIAKAVSYNAKIIVLDEPTSSLTEREVKKLFSIVNDLKAKGVSFMYISHKMDEVFEICDAVSVLRDGKLIMTKNTKETNMNELISAMVGRSLDNRFPPVDNVPGKDYLEVSHLTTKFDPKLEDISFTVRKGEIFGLYGLVGAGRSELLESMFGIRTIASGRLILDGRPLRFRSSKDAMDYDFALVTEERKLNGMFGKDTIKFNTVITNLPSYRQRGVLNMKLMTDAANRQIRTMRTKCVSCDELITALSGGNQQKVIIGKWLEREPNVFLLDEPTRGIDVGAKYEIYQLIIEMAKNGKTIIVVSSEMPEILGITNRIAVMSNHRLAGIVETKNTNQEELLRLSAMYL